MPGAWLFSQVSVLTAGVLADTALRLEQRGLAATWSGLRIAYAAGGDGESDTRVDLRNFAAFVRDPTALVTCLLLPHSCSVKLQMQVGRPTIAPLQESLIPI